MRSYETDEFEVTFNGDLISVDVVWDKLTDYIVAKYSPITHYVNNNETFFTINMISVDEDAFCEDMDQFCELANASDEELTAKINGLLSIASTSVRKIIYDKLGQTKRDVPDAGTVKQPDVQKAKADVPQSGGKDGSGNSLF